MTPAARARGRVALGLLLAALSGGCAGSLFKTHIAPPTMYMLSAGGAQAGGTQAGSVQPEAAAGSGGRLHADLAVLKPRVLAGLDTERIAALYPDRRLDYFADARWSGPLDEVVQDLVVQSLHSHAGLRNVSGDASAFASAYWLELEVADFQAEYAADASGAGGGASAAAPFVHVHFLARLGGSADRSVIARFEAEAREPAASNSMSAIVAAYNRAAVQALMQIAADCAAALVPEDSQTH